MKRKPEDVIDTGFVILIIICVISFVIYLMTLIPVNVWIVFGCLAGFFITAGFLCYALGWTYYRITD